MILTFGKYSGYDLRDVPSGSYLHWLVKQADLDETLRDEIKKVLGLPAQPPPKPVRQDQKKPETLREKFTRRLTRDLNAVYDPTTAFTVYHMVQATFDQLDHEQEQARAKELPNLNRNGDVLAACRKALDDEETP